jgi:hypothetical protein
MTIYLRNLLSGGSRFCTVNIAERHSRLLMDVANMAHIDIGERSETHYLTKGNCAFRSSQSILCAWSISNASIKPICA